MLFREVLGVDWLIHMERIHCVAKCRFLTLQQVLLTVTGTYYTNPTLYHS
jgi:hypothetical protein